MPEKLSGETPEEETSKFKQEAKIPVVELERLHDEYLIIRRDLEHLLNKRGHGNDVLGHSGEWNIFKGFKDEESQNRWKQVIIENSTKLKDAIASQAQQITDKIEEMVQKIREVEGKY